MPYIKLDDRKIFAQYIMEMISMLRDSDDPVYIKGEYLGYFVNRVVKKFLSDPDYAQNSFNSAHFNESRKKTIAHAADGIAARINRGDPISSAGDLNYSLTAVIWGFLGDAEGLPKINYGTCAYITGILERILSFTEAINVGSQRDMSLAFRRHIIARGVLHNILSETYRQKIAPFEQEKIDMNWDIWLDGKLASEHVAQ